MKISGQANYAEMVHSATLRTAPRKASAPRLHQPKGDVHLNPANRRGGAQQTVGAVITKRLSAAVGESDFDLAGAMKKKIHAMYEKYGIDPEIAASTDVSPKATAQRIIDFATSLFEVYKGQNPDMDDASLVDGFESTIRGAVQSGYDEAYDILSAMSMGEDILATAAETKTLLDSGFDDYFAELRESASSKDESVDVEQKGAA